MINQAPSNREKMIAIFTKQPEVRPIDLVRQLGIGHVMVHRYLLQLQHEGIIIKKGTPPKVYYYLVKHPQTSAQSG